MGVGEPGPGWGPLQLVPQQKLAEARRLGAGFPGGGGKVPINIPGRGLLNPFQPIGHAPQ